MSSTKTRLAQVAMRSANVSAPSSGAHPTRKEQAVKKKRVNKGKMARTKGSRFELRVAKLFKTWYGGRVERTPMSGGWQGGEEFGLKADLVFGEKKARYHIECFGAGTLVFTRDGYRPIETVIVGDRVLTHKGRFQKVTATLAKTSRVGTLTHKIASEPLMVTPNHPFETFDGEWLAASKVKHVAQITKTKETSRKWLSTWQRPKVKKGTCLCGCGTVIDPIDAKGRPKRWVVGHAGTSCKELAPRITLTPDLLWLLGLYIAEGHCAGGRVTWTVHTNKKALQLRVTRVVKKSFGLDSITRPSKVSNACTISVSSVAFERTILAWCGTGSRDKRLGWMATLSKHYASALLYGLFQGDGSVWEDYARYETVSRCLAYDMQMLLSRVGILTRISVAKNSTYSGVPLYSVQVAKANLTAFCEYLGFKGQSEAEHRGVALDSRRNRAYYPRAEYQPREGREKVYNLSVAVDETYVVQGGIVVHNCKKQEGWELTDLITGIRNSSVNSIEKWWDQTTRGCPDKKVPMLIFTRNQRPVYLMVYTHDMDKRLAGKRNHGWWTFIAHFRVHTDGELERTVMCLDDFLSFVQPPKHAPNRDLWVRGEPIK